MYAQAAPGTTTASRRTASWWPRHAAFAPGHQAGQLLVLLRVQAGRRTTARHGPESPPGPRPGAGRRPARRPAPGPPTAAGRPRTARWRYAGGPGSNGGLVHPPELDQVPADGGRARLRWIRLRARASASSKKNALEGQPIEPAPAATRKCTSCDAWRPFDFVPARGAGRGKRRASAAIHVDADLERVPARDARRGMKNGDVADLRPFRVQRPLHQHGPVVRALAQ